MTKKGAMARDLARPREKKTPRAKFTWVEGVAGKGKRPSGQDFGAVVEKPAAKEGGRKAPFSAVTEDVRREVKEVRKEALKK